MIYMSYTMIKFCISNINPAITLNIFFIVSYKRMLHEGSWKSYGKLLMIRDMNLYIIMDANLNNNVSFN